MGARFLHEGRYASARLGFRCVAVFLASAALFAGVNALHAQPTPPIAGAAVQVHLAAYAGRHVGATRFDETFDGLEGHVQRSFEKAVVGLGLDPARARKHLRARIHVHVLDADPRSHGADRARCWTERRCGKEHQRIELYAEYFLSGDSDLVTVLDHEMVHAVMRARMGRTRYERLPYWVREGLAVHLADEGLHHLRRTLLAQEDADALLTGLMARTRRLVMYPYAWLAIDHLEQTAGEDGLRRFVRGLIDGHDPRRTIREVTGSTWNRFLKSVRRYAQRRVHEEAAGLEDLKQARELYHQRRFPEARVAFGAFLEAHPDSAFAPTARYYRARAWYREGRYDQAAAAFQGCILTDLGRSGWIDECHLYLGIARHEQARDKAAVAVLRDYIDLHPYGDQQDLARLALGRALRRLGQPTEAQRTFQRIVECPAARTSQRRAAERELVALRERLAAR